MDYDEARDLIDTGDLIAVKRKDGLLARLTRLFTRSDYTHTGIAIWLEHGLWLSELNGGGNHLVPMSQLREIDFDVFQRPVGESAVRQAILDRMRVKTPYGFVALLVIGLLNWLRIKVFLHARRVLVCSGYCIAVYEDAGWPEHSRISSPADVTSMLNMKFSVTGVR